jgi:hypothetical protein
MKKHFGTTALALFLAMSLFSGAATAREEEQPTDFAVHVGDPYLFGLSGPLGDVARASNGDTIEVVFTGRIEVENNAAEGTGDFQHFDKSGKLLDFGSFKAKHLLGFTDFGLAGLPPPFSPTSHGGTALIGIRAVSYSASDPQVITKFNATLKVDCDLDPKRSPGFEEGVTLAVEGGLNFNQKVNGFTLYVAVPED